MFRLFRRGRTADSNMVCTATQVVYASALFLLAAGQVPAADWVAARARYSHHPQTGERVAQFAPIEPVYAAPDPYVAQNGYRHIQSVIRAPGSGDSADYLHVVEQWGPMPVRPYGEWQFPYRPYSVPYPLWGPPPPIVVFSPFGLFPGGLLPATIPPGP